MSDQKIYSSQVPLPCIHCVQQPWIEMSTSGKFSIQHGGIFIMDKNSLEKLINVWNEL